MNNPTPPNPNELARGTDLPPDTNSIEQLQESVDALRSLIQVTMGVLILLIAAVNVYLWHQTSLVRQQAITMSLQAQQLTKVLENYQTNSFPLIQGFHADLRELAAKDTNIAAVLRRHPLPRSASGQTNTVGTAVPR